MSLLRCNPYEPTFLACAGVDLPARWYPYGPGLPVRWEPLPQWPAPFALEVPADLGPELRPRGPEDEWAVSLRAMTTPSAVPAMAVSEPALGLLLLLVCLAGLWRTRC